MNGILQMESIMDEVNKKLNNILLHLPNFSFVFILCPRTQYSHYVYYRLVMRCVIMKVNSAQSKVALMKYAIFTRSYFLILGFTSSKILFHSIILTGAKRAKFLSRKIWRKYISPMKIKTITLPRDSTK